MHGQASLQVEWKEGGVSSWCLCQGKGRPRLGRDRGTRRTRDSGLVGLPSAPIRPGGCFRVRLGTDVSEVDTKMQRVPRTWVGQSLDL